MCTLCHRDGTGRSRCPGGRHALVGRTCRIARAFDPSLSEALSDELEPLLPPELVLAGEDLQAEVRLRTEGPIDLDEMRVGRARPGNRKDRVFLAAFDAERARRHEPGH